MATRKWMGLLMVCGLVNWAGVGVRAATVGIGPAGTNQTGRGGVQLLSYPGISLKGTAAAPRQTTGKVQFESGRNQLKVQERGLAAGTYVVRATRKSDGSIWVLGPLVVTDPTQSPDKSATQDKRQDNTSHWSSALQATALLPMPRGLEAKELSQVSILDAGGVVLLAARF